MNRLRLAAAALAGVVACGCGSKAGSRGDSGAAAATASVGASEGAFGPSASSTAAAGPAEASQRVTDPRWKRALGEDDAARIRLANEVGAEELVQAIDQGGDVAKAAIASLPFAPDADLALGALAVRARASPPSGRRGWIELIDAIAARPRDQRDPLDPEGIRAALAILLEIARDPRASGEERAIASTAVRALAERGYARRPEGG